MSFILQVWHTYLYEPLLNFLIFLYNTYADKNLGVAVIILTVSLRVVLLPLTVISERNKARCAALQEKVREIRRRYAKEPMAARDHIRRVLHEYRVSPWAKTALLAIQGLVLVLLYQVFISGIRGQRLTAILYPFIEYPGRINTDFYGFNIGERSVIWALAVGLVLFVDIYLLNRGTRKTREHLYYQIIFPLASFFALWYLPMVKSIFILTTLGCSYILAVFSKIFLASGHEDKKAHH